LDTLKCELRTSHTEIMSQSTRLGVYILIYIILRAASVLSLLVMFVLLCGKKSCFLGRPPLWATASARRTRQGLPSLSKPLPTPRRSSSTRPPTSSETGTTNPLPPARGRVNTNHQHGKQESPRPRARHSARPASCGCGSTASATPFDRHRRHPSGGSRPASTKSVPIPPSRWPLKRTNLKFRTMVRNGGRRKSAGKENGWNSVCPPARRQRTRPCRCALPPSPDRLFSRILDAL